MDDAEPILSVRHLVTGFARDAARAGGAEPGIERVLDDVSLELRRQAILGVVGESGSGKTVLALAIARLLPPSARILGGEIRFEGRDLLQLPERELATLRGRQLAIAFQQPATALSPVHNVGAQLALAQRALGQLPHLDLLGRARRAARARAIELLGDVELADPEAILDAYPHQLSAGMRRRVLIAMALLGRPALLVADEPTAGLDAPTQAKILDLFRRLAQDQGMSALFISQDLAAVAQIATDVLVMYKGQIVEAGPARSVFSQPQHPYTRALVKQLDPSEPLKIPAPGRAASHASAPPESRDGAPASRARSERECRFAGRCSRHMAAPSTFPRCLDAVPSLEPASARHRARCFYPHLSDLDPHE
jgi:oligopeptide/dipeptide ABC transporter ATP-binding protein